MSSIESRASGLKNLEASLLSEREHDPRDIVVITTTFYPKWQSREVQDSQNADNVRGNLALESARIAREKGFQHIIVDGGGSVGFRTELEKLGIVVFPEIEKGMSGSRRQATREAMKTDAKVICWTEPEKVSIIQDCLPDAVLPILEGKADIVVPKRNDRFFHETYPDYQVRYEERSNRLWNAIMKSRGFLSKEVPDLDMWFGPKFYRNIKEVAELFLVRYEFNPSESKLHQIVNPEQWPNHTFIPISEALRIGLRVVGVEVPYRHPQAQTVIETNNPGMERKRDIQYKNIIDSTIHYIHFTEGNLRSRLKPAD